ncbi:hypothetical protein F8M41_015768 [Gigaspora margarita]|uniref:Uncharacterized protein n=1 Tax=Gigaspora margarita TaxID=4874 RepID=A0A8H3WV87_GIGMA|nr:hypothetical protein F8M41_015768 [Gigaspora margarita]
MKLIPGLKEISDYNNSTLIWIFNLDNDQLKFLNFSEHRTTGACEEHQLCIDKMLDGIIPLANNVLAKLIQNHHPKWYGKLILVQYPEKVIKFNIKGIV